VDGGNVAREPDSIVVTGGPAVPEPSTILLLGMGFLGLVGLSQRRRKSQYPGFSPLPPARPGGGLAFLTPSIRPEAGRTLQA
jgi:hypothetical protein